MELSENIKAVRERKRVSQTKLAELLNMSKQTYWAMETGKTEITVRRLFEIAEILEVSPLELLMIDNQLNTGYEEKIKRLESEIEELKTENKQTREALSNALTLANIIPAILNSLGSPIKMFNENTFSDEMKKEEYKNHLKKLEESMEQYNKPSK